MDAGARSRDDGAERDAGVRAGSERVEDFGRVRLAVGPAGRCFAFRHDASPLRSTAREA